ncbi:unnamed protein product, partial [Arabidopsis halleri]
HTKAICISLHLLLLRAHCSFCQIPVLISLVCPHSLCLNLSHKHSLFLSCSCPN